ncbi:HlyD family efflux transporter periplasmic adaptor subunit [Moraxella sp.]|uniref:efflux RND transporter periplasmic adaptor subunit n=1 Tax=Moraxella sp. TaxID=479 RepID=UPI002607CFB4|nr:HlyD family efflux transporter periplasmic adaptor subunit [Moraxella sp.]MCP3896819.1 HlyD family efflux transporter periplasmic adaptor subunit [Moraxella sp.]
MRAVYCLPYFFALLVGCQDVGSADVAEHLDNKIDNRDESAATKRDQLLQDDIAEHPVHFDGDEVILDSIHLSSVKMSRYQPSFSLQGIIAPIQRINLVQPIDITVANVLVKSGDAVKKGDTLAHLQPLSIDAANEDEERNSPSEDEQIIMLTAPFGGAVDNLHLNTGMTIKANTPLLTLVDESKYQFISRLPAYLKPHLKIGKTVDISVDDAPFSGQIARVTESPESFSTIDVSVEISPKKDSANRLTSGQFAKGIVEYGQISVGALVPEFAIVDDDLSTLDLIKLHTPPHKPQAPIAANVWVVKQDASLTLSRVHIIEYLPESRRFLVSGITEDSLIVLAELPMKADGKRVVVD